MEALASHFQLKQQLCFLPARCNRTMEVTNVVYWGPWTIVSHGLCLWWASSNNMQTKLTRWIWLFGGENNFSKIKWRQAAATAAAAVVCCCSTVSWGHCEERRERAEHWWIIHHCVLYYCYRSLPYAQGNDSAVQLWAPPSSDLKSTLPNQTPILWYYTYIIYHPSLQKPLSPTLRCQRLILIVICVF